MIALVEIALTFIAAVLLLPAIVVLAEIVAALIPRPSRPPLAERHRPRAVIVVPAHNEESVIEPCLRALRAQMGPEDEILVVADNCSDSTAAVARNAGVTVLERHSASEHGKGYALDEGIRALQTRPPEAVVIIDADCLVAEGTLNELVHLAVVARRPAQAVYVVEPPTNPTPGDLLSALAVRVKNLVRPRGLDYLGLPCMLQGSGMAFSWSQIHDLPLATGRTAEDIDMTVSLAERGAPPVFCPQALVTGRLHPGRGRGARQRARWEHGHLEVLPSAVLRVLLAAARQHRAGLVALALEIGTPPLSLLYLLDAAVLIIAGAAWITGAAALPGILVAAGGALLTVAIFLGWCAFGRSLVPLTVLLKAPLYAGRKVPLYAAFFRRRQAKWKP